ncbi:MAG: hypothetical protein MUF87_19715 [Anaerolineae bacterium]|nr:hypothetical protein [Anaerolineae bacterium]
MTPRKNRRIRARVIASLIFLSLTGVILLIARFAQQTQTTRIPSGVPTGEIAYISDQAGTWDLYLLRSDGQSIALTPPEDAFQDYFVSWDFAAERLNFLTNRAGDEMGPGQVQPDGTGLRTLSILQAVSTLFFEGRIDWDPAWSPDGSRVVWSSLRDLNLELYLADADGENITRLTAHGGRDWFASWSPDGTQIAFNSDREGDENIYVINADGTDLRQLTAHPADDFHAMWSMDGTLLVFVSEREAELTTGELRLYAVPVTGNEDQVRPFGSDEVFTGDPLWARDGQSLITLSNQEGTWSLYQQDQNGGNLRRLTQPDRNSLFPAWRP